MDDGNFKRSIYSCFGARGLDKLNIRIGTENHFIILKFLHETHTFIFDIKVIFDIVLHYVCTYGENFLKWDSSKQKWHDFWAELWANNDTKWDQNGPHSEILECFDELKSLGLVAEDSLHYEPGCGRAYVGAMLASQGYQSISEDLNSIAVDEAKKLHQDIKGLTIRQADFFNKRIRSIRLLLGSCDDVCFTSRSLAGICC